MAELAKVFAPGYRKGETLPAQFGLADLYSMAKYAQVGRELGMPAWGQDQLLNKMLLEGRADAGYNRYDTTKQHLVNLEQNVKDAVKGSPLYLNTTVSGYPSAVLGTEQSSRRTGLSREHLWNGTGKNADTGRTGLQHAQRAAEMVGAQNDPRNADIKDFMERAAKDNLTPKERLAVMGGNNQLFEAFNNQDNEAYVRKYMRDKNVSFDDRTQAMLSDPKVLKTAYLRGQGIELPKQPYAWEAPNTKAGVGSPTYYDRANYADRVTELNMLERDPKVKEFIQDRLNGPVREPTVIDKFHDWLDTRQSPFKSQ
jgi:hypothetical protein